MVYNFRKLWAHRTSQSDSDSDSDPEPANLPTASGREITLTRLTHPDSQLSHAAFCTTSYFLSKLLMQSLGTSRDSEISQTQQTKLKILNAFVMIAVVDSKVVSVIANTSWRPTLHLFMATDGHDPTPFVEDHEPLAAPEGHQPVSDCAPSFTSRAVETVFKKLQVIFTTNPRVATIEKDKPEDLAILIIVNASPPPSVSERDLPTLVDECRL